MTKAQKSVKMEKLLEILDSSLRSHIPAGFDKKHYALGDKKFHKQCVKEYEEARKIVLELFEEL